MDTLTSTRRITLLILVLLTPLCRALTLPVDPAWNITGPGHKGTNSGRIVQLAVGDKRFPALYHRHEGARESGAVLILHERGEYPAWPDVVSPLARGLPRYGWSTLALRLPTPSPATPGSSEAGNSDARDSLEQTIRLTIDAAIARLQKEGVSVIVLLGYGLGAAMAQTYLAQAPQDTVKALVAVSPYSTPGAETFPGSVPVLDVFGERDLPQVIRHIEERARDARRAGWMRTAQAQPFPAGGRESQEGTRYRPQLISGAGHDYRGFEELLLKYVLGWLRRQVAKQVH